MCTSDDVAKPAGKLTDSGRYKSRQALTIAGRGSPSSGKASATIDAEKRRDVAR
jgi:hypothetical protein